MLISLPLLTYSLIAPMPVPAQAGGYHESIWENQGLASRHTQTELPDINRDGIGDWAIHNRIRGGDAEPPWFWLRVTDGKSGSSLWEWKDPVFSRGPGTQVVVGNFHKNAGLELAAAFGDDGSGIGLLVLFAADSGQELWRQTGPLYQRRVDSLIVVDDADGDGLDDLLCLTDDWFGYDRAGMAMILGGNGETLWERSENGRSRFKDDLLLEVQDVDGDGIGEIFLADENGDRLGGPVLAGFVARLDPRNGEFLWKWTGPWDWAGLGSALDFVDFDHDGNFELVVLPATFRTDARASVHVLDPVRGSLLWTAMEAVFPGGPVQGLYAELTGDGILDAVFSAPQANVQAGGSDLYRAGAVRAYSGASGNRIWGMDGSESSQGLGTRLMVARRGAGLAPGVVITDELESSEYHGAEGNLHLLSGRTGVEQWLVEPDSGRETLIGDLLALDLDGDGWDEILKADPRAESDFGFMTGMVKAYNSADGSLVWRRNGTQYGQTFGRTILPIGDAVLGRQVLAVGSPEFNSPFASGYRHGKVSLLDAASGEQVWEVIGSNPQNRIGSWLQAYDLNADGKEDIVSALQAEQIYQWSEGTVMALDHVDGHELWTLDHLGPGVGLLSGTTPDLDGDSIAEFRVRTEFGMQLVSGGQGSYCTGLQLSDDQISVKNGGRIELAIDLPRQQHNAPYQVLASLAGTGPTYMGELAVPLTKDRTMVLSYLGIYPPGLVSAAQGRLDPFGDARAEIHAPPTTIPPALIGMTLNLAVVCGREARAWEVSTIAQGIEILP